MPDAERPNADKHDPPAGKAPAVQKLEYEPWPQRRATPKPVKVLIWVAIVTHALGIIPAVAFLYYAVSQDTRLIDMLGGGVCCFPVVALVALGLFLLMMKAGGHDDR